MIYVCHDKGAVHHSLWDEHPLTQIPTMVQFHALATVKWLMVVKHVDVTPRGAFIHQSQSSQSQPYPFTAAVQDSWLLFRKGKSKTLTLIAVLGAVFGACGWTKASKPKNTIAHRIALLIRRSNFSMVILLVQGSNWTRATSLTARAVFLHTWSPLSWAKMSAEALLKKCVFFPAYVEMCSESRASVYVRM